MPYISRRNKRVEVSHNPRHFALDTMHGPVNVWPGSFTIDDDGDVYPVTEEKLLRDFQDCTDPDWLQRKIEWNRKHGVHGRPGDRLT